MAPRTQRQPQRAGMSRPGLGEPSGMHPASAAGSGWDRHARSGWRSRSEWQALTHHELAPHRVPGASPSRRRGPRTRPRHAVGAVLKVRRRQKEILRGMVQRVRRLGFPVTAISWPCPRRDLLFALCQDLRSSIRSVPRHSSSLQSRAAATLESRQIESVSIDFRLTS